MRLRQTRTQLSTAPWCVDLSSPLPRAERRGAAPLGGRESRRSVGSREEPGTDVRSATASRSHRGGSRPGSAGAAVASHGGWVGPSHGGRQHGRNRPAWRGGGAAVSVTEWSAATVHTVPFGAAVCPIGGDRLTPKGGPEPVPRWALALGAIPGGSATGIGACADRHRRPRCRRPLRPPDLVLARHSPRTGRHRPHRRRVGRVCAAALLRPGVIVMPRPRKESRWPAPPTATPARSPVPGGGHHARTR